MKNNLKDNVQIKFKKFIKNGLIIISNIYGVWGVLITVYDCYEQCNTNIIISSFLYLFVYIWCVFCVLYHVVNYFYLYFRYHFIFCFRQECLVDCSLFLFFSIFLSLMYYSYYYFDVCNRRIVTIIKSWKNVSNSCFYWLCYNVVFNVLSWYILYITIFYCI